MEDLIKEIRDLKKEVIQLQQLVKVYMFESQNDLKFLSNRLTDKIEDLRRELKKKTKKIDKKNETNSREDFI